jgi:hypothetical protein
MCVRKSLELERGRPHQLARHGNSQVNRSDMENINVWSVEQITNAQIEFAARWPGWDGNPHSAFAFRVGDNPELYGEYINLWAPNGHDYDLEFGPFGFRTHDHFGNSDPAVRQHFTAEEIRAIEHRLRAFAYDPDTFPKKFKYGRFLDRLSFRPDWIIQRSP